MKKKLLSLALALCMCAGLAIPASASPGFGASGVIRTITASISGGEDASLRLGAQSYQVQSWSKDEAANTYTLGASAALSADQTFLLPQGTSLILENAEGNISDATLSVKAWSDPDGDGIYTGRIAEIFYETSEDGEGGDVKLLPADTQGPLTDKTVQEEDRETETFYVVDFNLFSNGYIAYYVFSGFGDGEKTVEVSADYLAQEFGPNSLVQISYEDFDTEKEENVTKSFFLLVTGKPLNAPAEPEQPEPPAFPFTDVAETSPYRDAILWAVDQGITNGTSATTFSPSSTCTVRQILTFLYRAAGKPGAVDGQNDLDAAVAWAIAEGILTDGIDSTAACTRSMAVEFMWSAAGCPEAALDASFTDVDTEASYIMAVSWALEKGITNGTGADTFSPDNTCTRGQIVTFLYRNK